MANWPGAHWYLPMVQPCALLLAVAGALWLFLPRGVLLRWLGALLFLPLLLPPHSVPADGAFRVWVLDVGQGLSVLVRTRGHVLVYDTGARYPSGFDLGDAVVLPAIHALGLRRVDVLMISHGDNDHAGGAEAVADAFPQARRLAGEPARMHISMDQCVAGQAWRWDGVHFRVLNPPPGGGDRDNDSSCVLLVEGRGGAGAWPGAGAGGAASWQQDFLQCGLHRGVATAAGAGVGGLAQPLRAPARGGRGAIRRGGRAAVQHGGARCRGGGVSRRPAAAARAWLALAAAPLLARVSAARLADCHACRSTRERRCYHARFPGCGAARTESAGYSDGGRLGDGAHPDLFGGRPGDRAGALLDLAPPFGVAAWPG